MAIVQSVSEWQRDKVDWFGKNADLLTLINSHDNVPWGIAKKLNEMNKPLQPFINPKILVKISLLDFELPNIERRTLKK